MPIAERPSSFLLLVATPFWVHWIGLGPRASWDVTAYGGALWLAFSALDVFQRGAGHLGRGPVRLNLSRALAQCRRHRDQVWLGWGGHWGDRETARFHQQIASPTHLSRRITPWQLLHRHGKLLRPGSMGHTLVMGAPGTGKTQLFQLLAVQAIGRGDAVIVVDPKGSACLRELLTQAAQSFGRTCLCLLPAQPEISVGLNPLAHGRMASELASRICHLLPRDESENAFGQFAWMTSHRIMDTQLALGQRPTLVSLRRHVLDQGKSLYRQALATGQADATLSGIAAVANHDPVHYAKMAQGLLIVLESLTAGPLAALLSPDEAHPASGVGPWFADLADLLREPTVLYVSLDALSDIVLARALGSILLADLAALAGERYRADSQGRAVHILVDEAAEVSSPAFVQLLNKGRECGFTVTFAVQTLADLETAMGEVAAARMMIGNAANLIAFRTLDPGSQQAMTDRTGSCWIESGSGSITTQRGESTFGTRQGSGAAWHRQRMAVDRVPAAVLGTLRDLEFLLSGSDGEVWAGRIPLIQP